MRTHNLRYSSAVNDFSLPNESFSPIHEQPQSVTEGTRPLNRSELSQETQDRPYLEQVNVVTNQKQRANTTDAEVRQINTFGLSNIAEVSLENTECGATSHLSKNE